MRFLLPRSETGFTLIELLVVVSIIALLIGILLPALSMARKTANQMKNSAQLRGIHQAMVIDSQNRNGWLTGMLGEESLAAAGADTGFSGAFGVNPYTGGQAPSSRLWLLLNGQYIDAGIIISPVDSTKTKWATGPVTTSNFSYSMLQLVHPTNGLVEGYARRCEWRDNCNSKAILLFDRKTTASNQDNQIQSLWTTNPGQWYGSVLWSDNHAEFAKSNFGFETSYHGLTNANDNLFEDDSGVLGVTEINVDSYSNCNADYY